MPHFSQIEQLLTNLRNILINKSENARHHKVRAGGSYSDLGGQVHTTNIVVPVVKKG